MKILFISSELIGSAICQKLHAEGNNVKLYIHKNDWKQCLDGIITKTSNWREELMWVGKEGLIVFDDVIFGEEQDLLRQQGYNVVGSSLLADKLELDRSSFQKLLQDNGIPTIPSYSFVTALEAIDFIKNNPGRWVVKQSTHLSSLNFIGESETGEDVIEALKLYDERKITPVYVQKFIKGIEVGVARYFNGDDWIGPVEINHEHKKLYNNNIGPLTPEMGTVLWYTSDQNRIFKETLAKLKPHLQKINFRGDFDINCIINEAGVWPIEATPRFGSPSSEIQVELHTSHWSDFLVSVAKGSAFDLKYKQGYGIGISITCPPFPHSPTTMQKIRKVFTESYIDLDNNLTTQEIRSIHPEEVSKDSFGRYYWSGYYGWLLHVTAHGDTITEARQKAYNTISKINVPGIFFRTDIGERVESHDIPKLKKWGWL